MVEVLDQATWLRTKNETVMSSVHCESGLLNMLGGNGRRFLNLLTDFFEL